MQKQIIILTLLTLSILFLRFYNLESNPVALYWDEIAIFLDARSIAQTSLDMHSRSWLQPIFPSYGDYKLPVYIWTTSIFVHLFGATQWIVRIPNAIAGVITIFSAGYIAWSFASKKVKNDSLGIEKITKNSFGFEKLVASTTMLVVAFSPWSYHFSRTGFEAHLGQAFVALSVVCVIVSQKIRVTSTSNKFGSKIIPSLFFIGSIVLGVLAIYSYFSVRFVWPFVWVGSLVVFYLNQKKGSSYLALGVRVCLGGLLVLLLLQPMRNSDLYEVSTQFRLTAPSVLNSFEYAVQSNMLREASGNTLISRILYHRHWLLIQNILQNYSAHLTPSFLFLSGENNLRHSTGMHGMFVLPLFIPFVIGTYDFCRKRLSIFVWMLVWIAVAFLPASIPLEVPHALRSINALVPFSILIGWGLALLLQNYKYYTLYHKTLMSLFLVSILLFTTHYLYHYWTSYPIESASAWQDGYNETAREYIDITQKESLNLTEITHQDDRFYLWILAQPELSSKYIQTLTTDGFKPKTIYNLKVSN